jgi:LacI family transcriptional regulator
LPMEEDLMPRVRRNRPTLKDVAALAGTSVATASNVLSSRNKCVSEALAARVREAAEALGYRPNMVARSMKGKSRNLVAVLIPEFWNPVFTKIVTGAERVAAQHGYLPVICSTEGDQRRQDDYLERLVSQQVDGCLIAPVSSDIRSIQAISAMDIPFVLLDRPFRFPSNCFVVAYDMRGAAERGVEHLVAHGHTRIGFIGWDSPSVRPRVEGFADGVAKYGLDPADCPVMLGELSRESGADLACRCLETADITALFIGHHHLGEGAVMELVRMGVAMPDQLSVIVFGNPTWAQVMSPALTCIDLPDIEMGQVGMELLIKVLRGEQPETPRIMLDCTLVSRASVKDLTPAMR